MVNVIKAKLIKQDSSAIDWATPRVEGSNPYVASATYVRKASVLYCTTKPVFAFRTWAETHKAPKPQSPKPQNSD